MNVDTVYLGKLLNSATTAMFAVFSALELPQEIIDQIISNDPKGLEECVGYLKAADLPPREKEIRTRVISWAISTIAICGQCGMVLQKHEETQTPDRKSTHG